MLTAGQALQRAAHQPVALSQAIHTRGLSVPVPPNAHVAEFIPFDVLLPRASVLITNGGFGGTQQAIAAGVPVIVAGLTEDKPAVAARVYAAHDALSEIERLALG